MQKDGVNDAYHEHLKVFLSHVKGERIDIAAAVYHMILKEENKEAVFRYFLENVDMIESSEDREVESFFTATEVQKLDHSCRQLAIGILDNIIEKGLDEDAFYCELWRRGIEGNTNLPEEKEKIYALYRIWMDGRIPYFKLEKGLRMSNEKFYDITREKSQDIQKIIFILNSKFSQRTERSSQLLKILAACDTEDEKAVLFAHILFRTEKIGHRAR